MLVVPVTAPLVQFVVDLGRLAALRGARLGRVAR